MYEVNKKPSYITFPGFAKNHMTFYLLLHDLVSLGWSHGLTQSIGRLGVLEERCHTAPLEVAECL